MTNLNHVIQALVQQEVERLSPILKEELLAVFKAQYNQDRYLSRKEAAEYLSVCKSSIDNYVKDGLPKYKLGKATRFKISDIDVFVMGRSP